MLIFQRFLWAWQRRTTIRGPSLDFFLFPLQLNAGSKQHIMEPAASKWRLALQLRHQVAALMLREQNQQRASGSAQTEFIMMTTGFTEGSCGASSLLGCLTAAASRINIDGTSAVFLLYVPKCFLFSGLLQVTEVAWEGGRPALWMDCKLAVCVTAGCERADSDKGSQPCSHFPLKVSAVETATCFWDVCVWSKL